MLRLVINADDFGLNNKINQEILRSFKDGILRSASIMACGNAFQNAVKLSKENPDLDIGIHLTLVKGKPVLNPFSIKSLVDQNGYFINNTSNFIRKYFIGRILLDEIEKELFAQIDRVLSYGIKITHIDSHQHLHMLPGVLDIIVKLSKKFSIEFIRFPRESIKSYMLRNLSLYPAMQLIMLNSLCSIVRSKISYTTDYFSGFYFGGRLDKQNLLTLIDDLPLEGTCELMCHPGLSEADKIKKHTYRKVEESESLIDPEVKEVIKRRKTSVVSFRELLK